MGFKENLKMLRKSKGMTQEEFGKSINKTLLTISRYENGAIFPTNKTLKEICKVFNIEPIEILMNIEYKNKKYSFEEIEKMLKNKRNEIIHKNSSEIENQNIIKNADENHAFHITISSKKIWDEINKQVENYDFSKLFENKADIKNFIHDFSLMLRYDLIENHNNISHDDRLKILEDLKKYYFFLMSDYKENFNVAHELGHEILKENDKK